METPKIITTHNANRIIELNQCGRSPRQISDIINISYSSVYNFHVINGLKTRQGYTMSKDMENYIIHLCSKGVSLNEISNRTLESKHRIKIIAKKIGHVFRNYKYLVNEHLFDDMTSFDASYIAGLIMSDGNLRKRGNTIRICLKYTDVDILQKITNLVQPLKPIRVSFPKLGQKQAYIDISSKSITDKLIKIGLSPNKSLSVRYPFGLVDDNNFLRGIIDGDGCISRKLLGITGNWDMICDIQEVINKILKKNVKYRVYNELCKSGRIFTLYVSNVEDRISLLNTIYSDGCLCMDRKMNSVRNFYKQR